jgi:TDG/mug DNA glycosylase family protein
LRLAVANLAADELAAGGIRLAEKVAQYRPQWLAVLGVSAHRVAFGRPKATVGPQPERLHATRLWVLPNPSGLNAHYAPADLARAYAELRAAIEG